MPASNVKKSKNIPTRYRYRTKEVDSRHNSDSKSRVLNKTVNSIGKGATRTGKHVVLYNLYQCFGSGLDPDSLGSVDPD